MSVSLSDDIVPILCDACRGSGYIEVKVVEFVTKDMAIDAGDFGLQGQLITEIERHSCDLCGGNGFLIKYPEPNKKYFRWIGGE